jgi:hypothetical protein
VQSSSLTFSREGLKHSRKKIPYFSKNIKRSGSLTWGDIGRLVLAASPESQPSQLERTYKNEFIKVSFPNCPFETT